MAAEWYKSSGIAKCASESDFGRGSRVVPTEILVQDKMSPAGNVSGMGYDSRNRRQVHLDVATLQGATIVTA
jgi:hypothetical protein